MCSGQPYNAKPVDHAVELTHVIFEDLCLGSEPVSDSFKMFIEAWAELYCSYYSSDVARTATSIEHKRKQLSKNVHKAPMKPAKPPEIRKHKLKPELPTPLRLHDQREWAMQ